LVVDESQEMERVELPWMALEDLAVDRFGLGQVAGLMAGDCARQQRLEIRRRRPASHVSLRLARHLVPAALHPAARAAPDTAKLCGGSPRSARSHIAV